MRYVKIAFTLTLFLVMLPSSLQSKEWRGLVPMHSTCEDAKRVLGITKCQTYTYDLKDERVFINFSEASCNDNPPEKWNVPIGTILSITVFPKVRSKLADLNFNLSNFTIKRDTEVTDFLIYWNAEDGFYFVLRPNGEVDELTYFGTPKDNYLRCPKYKSPSN